MDHKAGCNIENTYIEGMKYTYSKITFFSSRILARHVCFMLEPKKIACSYSANFLDQHRKNPCHFHP